MNSPARRPLLQSADWAWMLGLMGLGLALRLLYFSGFGLGDDPIFRNEIHAILFKERVFFDNQAYRFAWWLPTALSCRILGLNEWGMVLPFLIASVAGIGLLYVFGKALWGRPGGVIAALLLLFHPLDFAWSTMLTTDIMLSFWAATTVLLTLRALEAEAQLQRRRLWILAGIAFWLAYHSKMSALFLVPALGLIGLFRWKRLDWEVLRFALTVGLLFGADLLLWYVFTGNPLYPYAAELRMQGLTPEEAQARQVSWTVFWTFPRMIFLPNHLGDLLYSLYPHLLVGLALLGPLLRLQSSAAVFWWLLFVFLGMQLNFQRVEGYWISGFRNFRHSHVFIYPMILLLAGYLVALRARWPRFTHATLGALLVFSAWQCVSAASKMKVAFADRRSACQYMATLPKKPIHGDRHAVLWCKYMLPDGLKMNLFELPANRAKRKAQIAGIRHGYLVTGGAREPLYSHPRFVIGADEVPRERWRVLRELQQDAPITTWRPEPLRVWEAIENPANPARAPSS